MKMRLFDYTISRVLLAVVLCLGLCARLVAGDVLLSDDERSSFTVLDWDELCIDSVLPTYSEVVPLETDYRTHDYRVSLEYPQYLPLTAREMKVAERFDHLLSDQIQVDSHVGVMRREGYLDISFLPFVKRDGKYFKLQSARIAITATLRSQAMKAAMKAGERYADSSRLAVGRWVKIQIERDGMYRLTRAALKKMGFAKPENVHLYGYGGHRLPELITPGSHYDDLPEQPLYYNKEKDVWLFWGNGLMHWSGESRVLNHYARAACYFLHEEDAPSQIETLPNVSSAPLSVVNSFTDHVLYERDQFAWSGFGRHLYDGTNYASSSTQQYKLQTFSSQGNERLNVVFTAGAKTITTMTPKVNGQSLTSISIDPLGKYDYGREKSSTYDVSSMKNGDTWNITLSSTPGNDAHLDYLALHYTRPLALNEGFVAFSGHSSRCTQFDVQGTGLKLMRIGSVYQPAAMVDGKQENDKSSFVVSDPSCSFVAFNPSYDFPAPTVVGAVANQNLHAIDSVDMVIIVPTSGKLTAEAQRLAQAHSDYDGMRCIVVPAAQIYNEFSSGTPDATAYRLFMKMLYDKGAATYGGPRYLLLFGDAAWDCRMLSTSWKKASPDDYLLCYESDNSLNDTQSYVMEDYFALLDDGEGADHKREKPDIGVGRFPVTTAAAARVMVDKTLAFLHCEEAGSWRNFVCMMGDDGDNNDHLIMCNEVAKQVEAEQPSVELRKVMWDAYDLVSSTTTTNGYPQVTNILRKYMKEGALVMNYSGHANTYSLSHEKVLLTEHFASNKTNKLGLWVTAACDVMPFDGGTDNIGETAVLTEGGGAMAFYGTARTVYATANKPMNKFFMRYLFSRDKSGRRYAIGDAIRLAKCSLIDGNVEGNLVQNKLQYALLGDPSLVFGAPTNRVVLDSINGTLLSDKLLQMKAGERVTLQGHIENDARQLLTDFSGILSARIYDNEQTITCKNNAGANDPFQFIERTLVYSGVDSISAGRFSLSFVVPVDINYSGQSARIVFYAADNQRRREANGHSEMLAFGGVSDNIKDDTQGPKIYMYLNQEDFQDGGTVNSTPCLMAQLEDESGINTCGIGIGHDLTLSIDDRADQTYVINESFTGEFGDFRRGTLAYSIPALEDGAHTLTLRAWDVVGNHSVSQLNFVVDASQRPTVMQVAPTQNPAVTSTTFVVNSNRPGSECTVTIDVFDFMGRRVWSRTERTTSSTGLFTIPWNLRSGDGGGLGTGIYLYRCILQCGDSREVTDAQKIVVLNNK